nr:hypothetical protein [Jiangella aurantiaca]
MLVQADERSEAVLIARLDLEQADRERRMWGLLGDRRPDLYESLTAG